jgi:hypothetical protein
LWYRLNTAIKLFSIISFFTTISVNRQYAPTIKEATIKEATIKASYIFPI